MTERSISWYSRRRIYSVRFVYEIDLIRLSP